MLSILYQENSLAQSNMTKLEKDALHIAQSMFIDPYQTWSSSDQYEILESLVKERPNAIASDHVYVHDLLVNLDAESVMIYISEFSKVIAEQLKKMSYGTSL